MLYLRFSPKDTKAIINATTKLIECNPSTSLKVKSISPELKSLCYLVREQLQIMGYMEYKIQYLRPLIAVFQLFGSFFNFTTTNSIIKALNLYQSYELGYKPIRYFNSNGDSIVNIED